MYVYIYRDMYISDQSNQPNKPTNLPTKRTTKGTPPEPMALQPHPVISLSFLRIKLQ